MIKIENWTFLRTEIYFDKEQKLYKTRICSMAKEEDFKSKLVRVSGIISNTGELFTSGNGIDTYSEDSVTTLNGEILHLGKINPFYSDYINAVRNELPIMTEVSLTRGISGKYQLKGNLSNKQKQNVVFKEEIVRQDVDKNLLYFADESYAFVDWVNVKFDDKVKLDFVRKKLDFTEFVGMNIMPIFKF